MIHRITVFAASLFLFATTASAGPNWQSIELSIGLADAAKVQQALDTLMKSFGDDMTGSVSLMASVAGGATSHSIISSFDSRAQREAWVGKLYASDAWKKYTKATAAVTKRGGVSRMDFVKSWGEDNAGADVFWELHVFTVTDEAAFLAALDAYQSSDTAKASGAQVHLSAVAAAGMSPATHVISVGFKNEAHAEKANADRIASKAWATYVKASEKAGSFSGTYMMRTVATWGNAGN